MLNLMVRKETARVENVKYVVIIEFIKRSVSPVYARSQNCEKELLASICLSVRKDGTTSAPTGRIFMKFDILIFFENPSRRFKFH
jgi:hypothetical protein